MCSPDFNVTSRLEATMTHIVNKRLSILLEDPEGQVRHAACIMLPKLCRVCHPCVCACILYSRAYIASGCNNCSPHQRCMALQVMRELDPRGKVESRKLLHLLLASKCLTDSAAQAIFRYGSRSIESGLHAHMLM